MFLTTILSYQYSRYSRPVSIETFANRSYREGAPLHEEEK